VLVHGLTAPAALGGVFFYAFILSVFVVSIFLFLQTCSLEYVLSVTHRHRHTQTHTDTDTHTHTHTRTHTHIHTYSI
jgi:hypothetical protein